jgi:hypothetical protein
VSPVRTLTPAALAVALGLGLAACGDERAAPEGSAVPTTSSAGPAPVASRPGPAGEWSSPLSDADTAAIADSVNGAEAFLDDLDRDLASDQP